MTSIPRIVISALAERRLEEIARFTRERFGDAQVMIYQTTIVDRVVAASQGVAHLRPLSRLSGQSRHHDLMVLRAGEHFLVLSLEPDLLNVLEIVHTSSDLSALELKE